MAQDNKPVTSVITDPQAVDKFTFNPITLAAPPLIEGLGDSFGLPVSQEELVRRIKRSYYKGCRDFRSFTDLYGSLKRKGEVAIIGAGPGLMDDIDVVREMAKPERGIIIAALNNAHEVLVAHGIKPDLAVMIESRDRAADYIKPIDEVGYIIGTAVADCTLERFKRFAHNTYLFHVIGRAEHIPLIRDMNRRFPKRNIPGVTGATTVGMRFFDLATAFLWAECIHFIGMDSSGTEEKMHARDKNGMKTAPWKPARLQTKDGRYLKRHYPTTPAMLRQAGEFWQIMDARADEIRAGTIPPFRVMFHGRGLLPDWAALQGYHVNSAAIKAELEGEGFDEEDTQGLLNSFALSNLGSETPLTPITLLGLPDPSPAIESDQDPADHD